MEGDVLYEYEYKGGWSLELNMGENVTVGVVDPLFALRFRSNR